MKVLRHRAWKLTICFCLSFLLSFTHLALSNTFTIARAQPVSSTQLDSQIAQAQSLQSLGFYRRALIQIEALNLSEQPDSASKVDGLHLLSDLQRTVGDLDAAQETIEAALTTAQTINASLETQQGSQSANQIGSQIGSQNVIEIASLLLSLGHIFAASGEIEQALTQYEEVEAITPTPQLELRSHLSKLPLLQSTNQNITDRQQIETLYSDIQTLIENLAVDRLTVNARLELARHQIENSSTQSNITPQSIAQTLAIAQEQARTIGDSRAESYALGYLGELYTRQQQLLDAQTALTLALEIANELNAADLAYRWQWAIARIYKQQGQLEQALASYENAVESLETLRGNLIAIAPDVRFSFREKVEPVYREWVDLLLSGQSSTTTLRKAQLAIESLQLAELEDFFKAPCIPPSTNIAQLIERTSLPSAVLYPIILSDRLEILLKLPGQTLQQHTVPITQLALKELLNQFQEDLRLPFTINQLQTDSAQLYDLLIRPVQSALERDHIDTLVFVLDGALRNIPMAALHDGEQYLIENYGVAIAPGLQMVDPQPLTANRPTTLIAGLSEGRHGFSDLPFVKQEISQIQQATNSRVLLNEDFTKARFTELLNNNTHRIVHLATHGQFSADADETFILAWDKPIKVDEFNALLRQSDQSNRQNNPDAIELLILSACETALGDSRAALGIAGVAVQAGARSTLATLWNIDDETSALFSDYFYQALQQPQTSKAQALRIAQLQILNSTGTDRDYQHPLYWAPYILLGNWL